ncbi:FAD binding domain-containing protein [Fusibacter sp. 3D3]|uniref:FAD binding domain-containing protein n=1 Tax=Fusibacter sp. 3D3 TaxID=1048380 RepID=UPI0008538DF3|nr:FAD binding domain-containing protein [Fusibacter sp. 3D3]GAU79941.1 xanthine dehydrogenase FAD binding subunit [Fusibacter sp. 3D3]
MIKIKNWVSPKTIDEAYQIANEKINNRVLGGGAFLRLAHDLTIDTAVDLSLLGLDQISETERYFEIGAMTTLRQLETSQPLNNAFENIFKKSLENIVGVQLRHIATIGGTVFARYGFSDLITALMVLETSLVFHERGEVSLVEYLEMPRAHKRDKKDILIQIRVMKQPIKCSFQMLRNSSSDFAILNAAVSKVDRHYKIAIGSRPGVACYALEAMTVINDTASINQDDLERLKLMRSAVSGNLVFGTNRFGSQSYRKAMSEVLVKRAFMEVNHEN